MCMTSFVTLFIGCVVLALIRYTVTLSVPSVQDLIGMVEGTAENILINTQEIFQDPLTRALCNLRTDELISYYGYSAEEHTVTTEDGYILSVFRCNSNKFTTKKNKKAVIIQHGLLSSSDEFCVNDPSQGLAYVLADAGYDVWLSNARGNIYSRRHESKNPNDPSSGFWHFSWYELALYDYPAVIDYVREATNNSKVFIIGHSQGTTTLMTLLSEKPEYNDKVSAASLLTPVGYLNNSDYLMHMLGNVVIRLKMFEDSELLPRNTMGSFPETFCLFDPMNFCGTFLNVLFGPSEKQRNNTLLASFFCHIPSGSSVNQLIHYSQELKYGFFGRYMNDDQVPSNFPLSKITTPLTLHYSPRDRFTNQVDIDRLIPQLNNSLVYVQRVDEFNHIDFVMGNHAASIVFSEILQFFSAWK